MEWTWNRDIMKCVVAKKTKAVRHKSSEDKGVIVRSALLHSVGIILNNRALFRKDGELRKHH